MEIKQNLALTQRLVMTPQLQQAIKLLQMSRMELAELVQEELLENPVLEDSRETAREEEISLTPPESTTIDKQVAEDDRAVTDPSQEKKDEIDWQEYLANHALQAPAPSIRRGPDEELPGVDQTLSRTEDLGDHVFWQVRMGGYVEDERKFAALVIGNLTDDGYLKMEGMAPEEIVPHLAKEAGLDAEDAEAVLQDMQLMEPLGVCSRSLVECLRVQAVHHGMDDLVLQVINNHLHNLEKRAYPAIARDLKVEVEEIYDIAQAIADLEPRPGRDYATEEPRYITPDVYVHKVGDEYYVVPNDDGMPKLKISGYYQRAMKNPKAKEYIQGKLRSAQWLIRSIDQRRKTIVKVTESIVEKQGEFFDKGIDYLKPMILRDIAEAVGMHESTISRVTSNKYVHTPRGIFELKFFFNSAIKRRNQGDIASESVKQTIRKMIAEENPKAPYSDQKIVELLSERDIKIARRTVAKYREMLGILSSSKRKKYF